MTLLKHSFALLMVLAFYVSADELPSLYETVLDTVHSDRPVVIKANAFHEQGIKYVEIGILLEKSSGWQNFKMKPSGQIPHEIRISQAIAYETDGQKKTLQPSSSSYAVLDKTDKELQIKLSTGEPIWVPKNKIDIVKTGSLWNYSLPERLVQTMDSFKYQLKVNANTEEHILSVPHSVAVVHPDPVIVAEQTSGSSFYKSKWVLGSAALLGAAGYVLYSQSGKDDAKESQTGSIEVNIQW